jgi:site-specific recombinase XerD
MLSDVIKLFLVDRRATGAAQGTLDWYRKKLLHYQRFAKSLTQGIPETKGEILAFLDGLECTDEGRAGYWRTIRAFHRWAADAGYFTDPTLRMSPRFRHAPERQIMPHETVVRVLASIGHEDWRSRRDQTLFGLIYFTGARVSEALGLTTRTVDLERRRITVAGKGNKTRDIPLSPSCVKFLAAWIGHAGSDYLFPADPGATRPLSAGQASHLWRGYQRAAGVPDPWRVHDLRHAFATRLREHDVDIADIQILLGHSTIQVTQRYARVCTQKLADAVDRSMS